MALEIRFPAVYERITIPRSDEDVIREMDRRCGYTEPAQAKSIAFDPEMEPRKGSKWERQSKQKTHEPLPPPEDKKTCRHEHGVFRNGKDREMCRACKQSRPIGATSWKSMANRKTKGAENRPFKTHGTS